MPPEKQFYLFRNFIYILHNPWQVRGRMAEWSKALVCGHSLFGSVGSKLHVGIFFLHFLSTFDALLAIIHIIFQIAL